MNFISDEKILLFQFYFDFQTTDRKKNPPSTVGYESRHHKSIIGITFTNLSNINRQPIKKLFEDNIVINCISFLDFDKLPGSSSLASLTESAIYENEDSYTQM